MLPNRNYSLCNNKIKLTKLCLINIAAYWIGVDCGCLLLITLLLLLILWPTDTVALTLPYSCGGVAYCSSTMTLFDTAAATTTMTKAMTTDPSSLVCTERCLVLWRNNGLSRRRRWRRRRRRRRRRRPNSLCPCVRSAVSPLLRNGGGAYDNMYIILYDTQQRI